MKVKLLVNTTIGGVFSEAGSEVEVADATYLQLLALNACSIGLPDAGHAVEVKPEVKQEVKPEAPTGLFRKRR